MIQWNLQDVIHIRNIKKPHQFLMKAGISRHSASMILSNEISSINFRHLEIICNALNCTPNDLLVWKPDPSANLSPDHELYNLVKKEEKAVLADKIRNLPLSKLKELQKKISTDEN